MNFNNIVNKFGYSEEFSLVLKEIYDELIKMFKNEELVYEALFNTKIVSVDNVYEYLNENNFLEHDDTLVTDNDLKRSAGVYYSSPKIDLVNNVFQLSHINRVVAVVNLDLTNTSKKASLIHELCHLIKSYHNEYSIEGDVLTFNSGLITSSYKLSFDGDEVTQKLISEVGVGLEEGLTSLEEEIITRNLFDRDYKSSGYGIVNALAANLIGLADMNEVVINAEVYHDKSELYKILGVENYQDLENLGDRIYKLNLEMFASAMNFEKMTEIAEQIKKIIREEYAPLRDDMESNLKRN